MFLTSKAKEEFNIEPIISQSMENMISKCISIYCGKPYWLNEEDHIKTVNFAKSVCSETARLTMLGTKVAIDGSARAEWLQEEIEKQGRQQYLLGNYELGKLNLQGQRISIRVTIPRKDGAGDVSFITGWMVKPGGKIKLTTPYGGK